MKIQSNVEVLRNYSSDCKISYHFVERKDVELRDFQLYAEQYNAVTASIDLNDNKINFFNQGNMINKIDQTKSLKFCEIENISFVKPFEFNITYNNNNDGLIKVTLKQETKEFICDYKITLPLFMLAISANSMADMDEMDNSYSSVRIHSLNVTNTDPTVVQEYTNKFEQILHLKTAIKKVSVFQRRTKLIGEKGKGSKKFTLLGGLRKISYMLRDDFISNIHLEDFRGNYYPLQSIAERARAQMSHIEFENTTVIEEMKICYNEPHDDGFRLDRRDAKGLKHIEIITPDEVFHLNKFAHKCNRDYYCLKPVCERIYMGVANPIKSIEIFYTDSATGGYGQKSSGLPEFVTGLQIEYYKNEKDLSHILKDNFKDSYFELYDQYEERRDKNSTEEQDLQYVIGQQQILYSQELQTYDHAYALANLLDHSLNDFQSVSENIRLVDNDFEVILKEVREEILNTALIDDVFKKLIIDNLQQIMEVTVDDTNINMYVKEVDDNIEKIRSIVQNFSYFIKNYKTNQSRHDNEEKEATVDYMTYSVLVKYLMMTGLILLNFYKAVGYFSKKD